ncbi:hypothetical protein GCM10023222_44750 [Saccharopolyspora cebuensis]|uniref:Uncharacterized protein n=1 Tax=Saccharopolyspora cebuensis TaxID=418759 RepID=A0ABV4CC14_9PSEU
MDGLEEPLLTGGCLMTAAFTEYDDRTGWVRCTIERPWPVPARLRMVQLKISVDSVSTQINPPGA